MKIDFHTHGKLSKGLPFSEEYTLDLFKEATEAGVDAICLTEHFNSRGYRQLLAFIATNYPQVGDCFMVEGLKVFIGMEVDILERGHVLVIGTITDILELHQQLEDYMRGPKGLDYEAYMRGETYIPARDLMTLCKQKSVLVGAAHAFREGSQIPTLESETLQQFDFFDLNGKDCSLNRGMESIIAEFARQYGKPMVAGSDTHQSLQYGCIYNVFEHDCIMVEELKIEMNAGRYEIEMLDYIEFKVKAANLLKMALKQVYGEVENEVVA